MNDRDRETACERPQGVPACLGDLSGYRWARDRVGESGCAIYRLSGCGSARELFLKHGHGGFAADVTDEMVRLGWLGRYVPVAAIVGFARTADDAWLLTTALPGRTAYQVLADNDDPAARAQTVDALAHFLWRLHAVPADACPFNSDHRYRLTCAGVRVRAGLVETDEFDEERQDWTAEQVLDALHRLLPLAPDRVVTHGDFSLDNIQMQAGQVVGCIDLDRAGIADRYQDLAILWKCLSEFDATLQARLWESYGIDDPDVDRLAFHLMLDELF